MDVDCGMMRIDWCGWCYCVWRNTSLNWIHFAFSIFKNKFQEKSPKERIRFKVARYVVHSIGGAGATGFIIWYKIQMSLFGSCDSDNWSVFIFTIRTNFFVSWLEYNSWLAFERWLHNWNMYGTFVRINRKAISSWCVHVLSYVTIQFQSKLNFRLKFSAATNTLLYSVDIGTRR